MYHELISTGRTFLSKVCPVENAWVQSILPKLHNVDVARLSGGETAQKSKEAAAAGADNAASGEGSRKDNAETGERRNADDAVAAARARYLARKAAAATKK